MNNVNSKGYIARLTLTLFAITAVVALLLSLVNAVTKDTIAQKEQEKLDAALAEVMPGEGITYTSVLEQDGQVVYEALSGGDKLGWCVQVAPNGYGGAITLVVGVDPELKVTGVSIVSHSETSGMGSKADDPQWLSQFVGKSGEITVKTGENKIDAVSGATVTSRAITKGVNAALELAAAVKGE